MSRIIDIGVRLRLQTLFSLAIWLIQLQAQLISSIQQLFSERRGSFFAVLGNWRRLINRQAHFLCAGCGGMGGESHATLGNILLALAFRCCLTDLSLLEVATVR